MRPAWLIGLFSAVALPSAALAGFYQADDYDDPGDPHLGSQELRAEWFVGQLRAGALYEGEKAPIQGLVHALAYRHSVLLTPFLTGQARLGRVQTRMEAGNDHGFAQTSWVLDLGVGLQLPNVRTYALVGVFDRTRVKPIFTQPTRSAAAFSQVSIGVEALYDVTRKHNRQQEEDHRKDQLMLWLGLAAEFRHTKLGNVNELTFLPSEVPANALLFTANIYYMAGL